MYTTCCRVVPVTIKRFDTLISASFSSRFKRNAARFIDWKRIKVEAGNGGDGCVSVKREANVRYGGPDGGDGGLGGSIWFEASSAVRSLGDLRNSYSAGAGGKGEGDNCMGRAGKNVTLQVPVGTVIKNWESKEVIADLDRNALSCLVVQGGNGGLGNAHFASATNQRPRQSTLGEEGPSLTMEVEMKIIADVGLVGFPNAGKSTLLRALSRAKPAVAAYPFTTLNPHVGMLECWDGTQIAVADIPGLIPGAHMNVGLGHSFLRHIERCTVLLFVIDLTSQSPLDQLNELKYELNMHQPGLGDKPGVVVGNKLDLEQADSAARELAVRTSCRVVPVSALNRWNVQPLKDLLYRMVHGPRT